MFSFYIPAFDSFSDGGVQRFAFRNRQYCHTLRPARLHQAVKGGRLPNRRWGLFIQMLRTAQRCEKLFAPAFVKAMKRVNIGTAVAIFGEEPGYRFRRMVGAHHDAVSHTGDAILRFHSLTRFSLPRTKSLSSIPASRSACSLARTAPLILTVSTLSG